MKIPIKSLIQTAVMMVLLALSGLYLYFFTNNEVFWGGFISMLFFYGLVFFMGSYIAEQKNEKNTEEEVMLAGRALPLWIAVFTMSATWIGGGYINGTAEATYKSGLMWVQAPWGYALSLIIGGLFFAKKMRRHQFRTMLDPLEQRFGEKSAALFFLPALVGELFWTAAILSALGSTFGVVLGVDFSTAVIISALVIIVYTSLGGLWAVAMTDVVQLILLIVGLIITVPYALEFAGGWDKVWADYQVKFGANASFIPSKEVLGNYYWNWWDYAILLVLGGIPWQVYFQRVLAAKDENTARNLSIVSGIVCLFVAVPAIMIGMIGSGADWAALGGAPKDSLDVLPVVMKVMTPPVIATIGLGAVAAAVMASADSSILSASCMASWNVYRPLINPTITTEGLANLIKKGVWVAGIAATLIALKVKSIYALWFLCSDFVYCLLFPALVCALFDKKANHIGALAGLAIAVILRFGGGDETLGIPCFLPYPIIDAATEIVNGTRILVLFPFRTFAMVVGLITIIVVSRLTQKISPPKELKIVE